MTTEHHLQILEWKLRLHVEIMGTIDNFMLSTDFKMVLKKLLRQDVPFTSNNNI